MSYSLNRLDLRTHTIIFGYVRKGLELTSFPGAIHKTSNFICIILSYINDHFIIREYGGSHTWSIDINLIIDIITSHNNKQYNSDPFMVGSITWKLIGYTHNKHFQLCLKPIITPNEWHRVLINASLYCLETLSGDTRIYGFDKDTLHLIKGPGCVSLNDIKNRKITKNNKQLTYFINIQILQISSINNKMLYQHQNNYKMHSVQTIQSTEWVINDIQLNEMKKSHPGKCFISGVFNNMFCLRIFPNGYNEYNACSVIIELQWIGLPPILCSKYIHWRIHCKNTDILTDNIHKFDYNQSFAIWGDNVLSFEEFKLLKTFAICLEIEINENTNTFENTNNNQINNENNLNINELINAPPYHPEKHFQQPKYRGVLLRFNEILKFGFIECDDEKIQEHLFVHETELRFNKNLIYQGMRLQFDIETYRNYHHREKKKAVNVLLEPQTIQSIEYDNESTISHSTTGNDNANNTESIKSKENNNNNMAMDLRLNQITNNITNKFNMLGEKQINDINNIHNKINAMMSHFSEQVQNLKITMNINQKNNEKILLTLKEKVIYLNKCYNYKQNEIKKIKKQIKYLYSNINDENENDNDSDEKQMSQIDKIRNWLNDNVKLPQYFQLFIQNGYDDFNIIFDMTNNELIQMGIDKIGHRKKIMKSIKILIQNENNNSDLGMPSLYSNFCEIQHDENNINNMKSTKINNNLCSNCKSFNFSDALICRMCNNQL